MSLVQRWYSTTIDCTGGIGFHKLLTMESHDVPEVRPSIEPIQQLYKQYKNIRTRKCHNVRHLKLEPASVVNIQYFINWLMFYILLNCLTGSKQESTNSYE